MIDTFNIELHVTNISLAALWILALWIYFRDSKLAGAILFYSFFTDHIYRLILVYTDQITYTVDGMDAPIWIHVFRLLSIVGHLVVPLGLWLLVKKQQK